jgi:nucleoside 2-deoxyribosyltransferase
MEVTPQLSLLTRPPAFCGYAGGACDQSFDNILRSEALFLYPNEPEIISATIEEAARQLRVAAGTKRWLTWKDLGVTGQIIFCQICKALRYTNFVVADVTTLNFNLLFEIGFAIGLGIPVLPIRDTSFIKDSKVFSELGLIDTLGYFDFQNSAQLVKQVLENGSPPQVVPHNQPVDKERSCSSETTSINT